MKLMSANLDSAQTSCPIIPPVLSKPYRLSSFWTTKLVLACFIAFRRSRAMAYESALGELEHSEDDDSDLKACRAQKSRALAVDRWLCKSSYDGAKALRSGPATIGDRVAEKGT